MVRKHFSIAQIGLACGLTALAQQREPAAPLDPIPIILNAFRSHSIVALSEGPHANEEGGVFRLALLRDPSFPALVNDIVVESGASQHQEMMDRFVRGESVPEKALRLVWQDTTQADGPWDVPMFEAFFREVRKINASLPPERKLRVLLGDPPFDWEHGTREEWLRVILDRDRFPAELIEREVLSKKRKALVIYGNNHLVRSGSVLVARLAGYCGSCVFNIWTHGGGDLSEFQPNVADWPVPALALVKNTRLGAATHGFFPVAPSSSRRLEEEFDAVLYLGSELTRSRGQISPSLCTDAEYMTMRLKRMDLTLLPPGAEFPAGIQNPIDRLKQYCASVTSK